MQVRGKISIGVLSLLSFELIQCSMSVENPTDPLSDAYLESQILKCSVSSCAAEAEDPTTPGSLQATTISTTQIDISWSASTDNKTAQGSLVYQICRGSVSGACEPFSSTYTTTSGVTQFSVTGLTAATTYYFRIRALDSDGKTSVPSAEFSGSTTNSGTVNTPTFSPVAGTYGATQNVTISTTTGGAIICYTTNGTTPACDASKTACTTGTLYGGTVSVSASATLNAIACLATYLDSSVNSAAYTIDTTGPSAPTSPSTSLIGPTQLDLTWTAATDAVTAQGSLVYEICQTTTPGGCTGFTPTYTTSAGATSYSVTGLVGWTTYYFKIRAKDSVNNIGAPSTEVMGMTGCQNQGFCYMFVTLGALQGNFGGPAGADSMCNSDGNKPVGTSNYKALLVNESPNRRASVAPNAGDAKVDWVLHPMTVYKRGDGTVIGNANGVGLFTFPLTNTVGAGGNLWTGLNTDWTTTTGTTCGNWTDNTVMSGQGGNASSMNATFIANGSFGCATTRSFVCVQQ